MVWGVVLSPAFCVFSMVSVCGTVLVLFSSGLLGMWLSLELAFFGFVPILNGKGVYENESAVKYFVVQSIGSGVLLVGILLVGSFTGFGGLNMSFEVVNFIILVGLMVKLGIFPLHFWFPSVMGSSSWFSCFWLSVPQKVGPFWILSGISVSAVCCYVFMLMAVTTSIIGAVGGLAQTQFRSLLAYSSLGQSGWMGLITLMSLELFSYYMILYSLLLSGLLWGLYSTSSDEVVGVMGWSELKGVMVWVFSGSFFISLAGMPPLSGFVLKLAGVMVLVNNYPIFLLGLIFSSMVSLYFYLSVLISSVVSVGGVGVSAQGNLSIFMSTRTPLGLVSCLNWFGGLPLLMVCSGVAF